MNPRWPSWGRRLFWVPILVLLSPLLLLAVLRGSSSFTLDVGPGDRDYVSGLGQEWRYDGTTTWREMGRRARVDIPVTVQGPGTLSLKVARYDRQPVTLRIGFDDGTRREVNVSDSTHFQEITVALPAGRMRGSVRLRTETTDGGAGPLKLDALRWTAGRPRPKLHLIRDAVLLLVFAYVALSIAGLSTRASFAGALLLALAILVWGFFDNFSAVHLVRREAAVAGLGVAVVGLARILGRRLSPSFLSLVFFAVLLKSGLLFHPRFWFYDLPIHQTLLEYVYHRGVAEFYWHFPDYQIAHGTGMASVNGKFLAFPYPIVFHALANMGNRLFHAPEFWLKLGGGLVSGLALFPLGYLARKVSQKPGADVMAGIAYLLTPAATRSLYLLELSALTGHLLDLVVLAYLARIELRFDTTERLLGATLLVTASLASYPSGFIHIGLLVGSCLLLSPWVEGLSRGGAFRFAGASLAGAALALLCYNPESIRNLFTVLLPTGIQSPATNPVTWTERVHSAYGRSLMFLGAPILVLGVVSVAWLLKRLGTGGLRLLLSAWTLSAVVAYVLRYVLIDLFLKQKELYWMGALLAVGIGAAGIHLYKKGRWRWLAILALAGIAAAFLNEFLVMVPRFYSEYLFL